MNIVLTQKDADFIAVQIRARLTAIEDKVKVGEEKFSGPINHVKELMELWGMTGDKELTERLSKAEESSKACIENLKNNCKTERDDCEKALLLLMSGSDI